MCDLNQLLLSGNPISGQNYCKCQPKGDVCYAEVLEMFLRDSRGPTGPTLRVSLEGVGGNSFPMSLVIREDLSVLHAAMSCDPVFDSKYSRSASWALLGGRSRPNPDEVLVGEDSLSA